MALAIGLTGGIGSGKTTVAQLFALNGAGLVDADEISHRLTTPGQPAVAEIARKFGPQFVATDGSLDRGRMRNLVFADSSARQDLEAILHPLIRQEIAREVRELNAPYIVVVVPLLFETGTYRNELHRILVVDCAPDTQICRVMARSGLSRDEVLSILASQVPRQERLRMADDVIHNDNGLEALEAQIIPLHVRYLGLATNG
ncbi:MAG: dephospho-CoA kinase [Betaproteobacteria bacterium]